MKKGLFQRLLPHLIAVVVFLVVALIYCRPVLEGKVLQQHDVTQWKAMAQDAFKYKEKNGHFPLWTKSMFSGMPAYQIVLDPEISVSPGIFYYLLSLGLPKPISFFFMACICFYFLSQVLRVNPYIGIIGSLAFAYATYNPIIIAAGHDTKMNSIALMPFLIGSVLLLYEKKYWLGGALTALATSLLVGVNHLQITYYAFLIIGIMSIAYAIQWIKTKQIKHLVLSFAIVAVASLTGLLSHSVSLFTTYEYAKESIRGGSQLADATEAPKGQKQNFTRDGLSTDYALSYSMYKSEPFVMMVPKMFGGSSDLEVPQQESKAIESLQQMPQELAQQLQYNVGSYWGGIGGTSGPPYVGAIICFLALLGFFMLDGKHKWWMLAASVLAIVMSWGSFFEGFNVFLLNNLPFYNKFRAPSMIIVIPTLLFCMLAVMTLQKIVYAENREALWPQYKKGLMLTGGVFAVLLLIYMSADFMSEGDRSLMQQVSSAANEIKEYVKNFLNALKEDRKGLFLSSLVRSFLFILAAAAMLWLSIKKNLSKTIVLAVIGVLAFVDVMAINTKYLNSEKYQDEAEYEANFQPSPVDAQILRDTTYYRVFDVRQGISSALGSGYAMPAYFHNIVGGYHPAKLSIYQDLIEGQLSKFPESLPVYNMLNTKYIIQKDQQGQDQVIPNPEALGAAWFVKAVRYEATPKAVMNALNHFHPKDTAVLFTADQAKISGLSAQDSAASIRLLYNNNDEVVYQSSAAATGYGVFSEIFYDKGWKAYIDGKETPIIRTNYVLRGLVIPSGQHQIRFEFHPDSFYTGKTLSTIAGILILLALAVAAFIYYKERKKGKA